ncbi:hypothetical protein COP1_022422 [Malus domestica]
MCNKEGSNTKEWIGDEQNHRGLTKEGCKARLIVVISKLGGYAITIFDEGHNHQMTSPRRRHLLKSHRKVGGIENVGYTQEDLYNYQRKV